MPKTIIREYDRTGVVQRSPISNIVYMPIETTAKVDLLDTKHKVAGLFSSKKELEEKFKNALDAANPNSRKAYNIAAHLLDLGFQVLAQGVTKKEEVDAELLKDKSLFDIRFLTAGCLPELNATLATVAAARQDCTALLNVEESVVGVADVRYKFEALGNNPYAAGFTPWFITENPTLCADIELADANSHITIPAAYGYLFAYGTMLFNGIAEWKAVAGPERGIIPELADVCYNYSYAEIEMLQARAKDSCVELDAENDNVGIAINPIADIRPNGYIIYGNRTLKDNDANKKTTAQSFLNVRNGVNAVKKVLYEASRKFVFEQNTEVLWINFKNYVTPLLDKMLSGEGILGYKFIKVHTDAKARLKARLTIIPVEGVEDFDIDVYLVDDLTVTEE